MQHQSEMEDLATGGWEDRTEENKGIGRIVNDLKDN